MYSTTHAPTPTRRQYIHEPESHYYRHSSATNEEEQSNNMTNSATYINHNEYIRQNNSQRSE